MQRAVKEYEDATDGAGPERPPYPAEVRDQLVRDLAATKTPTTAHAMLLSHEANKERMGQSTFFQYPTPPNSQPRNSQASRVGTS